MLTSCPHRRLVRDVRGSASTASLPGARRARKSLARTHGLPENLGGVRAGFWISDSARAGDPGRLNSPKLGLFELGTHRVVHIPNCSVQHA